jgi:flagellar FliJ protein
MAVPVPRRNRIDTLQRLASHTEAENARRLADRLRALDTEERRLQQIRAYLAEYGEAAAPGRSGSPVRSGAGAQSMTIGRLRSNRGFLERLRHAVDEQRATVETQRHQVEQQTRLWHTARARRRSLEKLGERLQQQEQVRSDRREQVQLDEIASSRSAALPKV